MNILDFLEVLFVINSCLFWFTDKECIMSISGWMGLRLEKSIKVPERWLYVTIGFHFLESHLCENFNKLLFSFHKNMKISILNFSTFWVWIELFEVSLLPWAIRDHCACKISDKFNSGFSVLRTFWNDEMSLSFLFDQLSLFECF